MNNPVTLTFATGLVLEAISAGFSYGFEIMDASGLPDGTVYPALRRLEKAGALESSWENEEAAHRQGRPARRNYRLTEVGYAVLDQARDRFPGLRWALGPDAAPGIQGAWR